MVDKNTSFHFKNTNRQLSLRTDLDTDSQIDLSKKWDIQNFTSIINKPKVKYYLNSRNHFSSLLRNVLKLK